MLRSCCAIYAVGWVTARGVDSGKRARDELSTVLAMPTPIVVDVAALRRLADSIANLAAELRRDAAHEFTSTVGDVGISTALADVQRDWSAKRRVICGYFDTVSAAARAAAEAYGQVESVICGAVTGPRK
jgi:hypothetical protein